MTPTPNTPANAGKIAQDAYIKIVCAEYSNADEQEEKYVGFIREAIERDRAERDARPWSVSLIVPTKADPFNHYECSTVDVGHADRILTVECPDLRKQLAEQSAALASCKFAIEQAEKTLNEFATMGEVHAYPSDWDHAGMGRGPEFDDCERIDLSDIAYGALETCGETLAQIEALAKGTFSSGGKDGAK